MRNDFRAELACPFSNGLRLHHPLGADAQRIQLAALDIADDQVLQHLLEVTLFGLDQNVILRAKGPGALIEHPGRVGIYTARIDGDGDDGATVVLLEPRHQE